MHKVLCTIICNRRQRSHAVYTKMLQSTFGFSDTAHQWIQSYLSGRKQHVRRGSARSSWAINWSRRTAFLCVLLHFNHWMCLSSITYRPCSQVFGQDTLLKLRCCGYSLTYCRLWRRVCPLPTGHDGSVWHCQSFDPVAAAAVNFWIQWHCPSVDSVIPVRS